MNVSDVTAKTAGNGSNANTRSVISTITCATSLGVAYSSQLICIKNCFLCDFNWVGFTFLSGFMAIFFSTSILFSFLNQVLTAKAEYLRDKFLI